MENTMKMYITADEVAELLGVSRGYAYKVIRGLNDELKAKGFRVISGKVPRKYFQEKYYGMVVQKKEGICAQILADVFSVDAIINTGIAGSLNKNINIGDIVLSTDVVQHDMDATGFGYRKGQIPQMPVFFFNADDNLRRLAAEVCKEVNPDIQVFEGRIASGDQFVCDQDVKNRIVSEFSAYATEMEGAAIGQAAYLNEIPFLVVRAISDKADGSAQMDYSEFEKAAVDHSVRLTLNMLARI